MRKLLVTLGFLALAGVGHAAVGTVDMTWDGCTGPIDKATNVPGFFSLFLTEIGHDQPTQAYDVRLLYGNAQQEVPDAWRFDADGCEGPARIQQEFISKACLRFGADNDSVYTIRIVRFVAPFEPYATTLMQVLFAQSYRPGNTVDPVTRYLLEHIRFDLNDAVPGAGSAGTCGGFEQPMCFALTYAAFVDTDGTEHPFNRARTPLTVTFNGPVSTCPGVVPVRAETWGSIKSQYRQ